MEFQAIILAAGRGSRISDLTSSLPKPLLPIANKPMIWYPVQTLENAGFLEAFVVVLQSQKTAIEKQLVEICNVKLKLEFICINDNLDYGTADTLRSMSDKITKDFLVISCDTITSFSLHHLADVHLSGSATVTMLLSKSPDVSESAVPKGKSNRKLERDIIGRKGNQILLLSSEADIEESLIINNSFIRRHPNINIETDIMDAHCYLMKRSVVDVLLEQPNISVIKGELVPYLVRKQFKKPSQVVDSACDRFNKISNEYSTFQDFNNCGDTNNRILVLSYMFTEGLSLRTNTLVTYCEANRQVALFKPSLLPKAIRPANTIIHEKAQIGAGSLVGEGSQLSEKVILKHSVIGRHCKIGEKCRLTNCVVMNHSVIEDGCIISGSIICDNCHIGNKSELKDSLVGNSQNVQDLGKFTNEFITEIDRMMEF